MAGQLPQPGQAINGYKFLGGDPKQASSWEALNGEEYIKSLPQSAQRLVPLMKKYAEGDMPVPTAAALRNPEVATLLEMTAQYDPSFTAADYPSRAATRKDFTSGQAAKNISSFNTVLQHLGKLAEDAKALNNHSFTPLNTIGNAIEPYLGDPRVSNFNTDKTAVIGELVRAFRGVGGARGDIEDWEKSFHANMSPQQLEGAIQRGVELLNGRIEALGDQYSRGMKRQRDAVDLLSPGAKNIFTMLKSGGISDWKFDHPEQQPAPQAQTPAPKPASKAPRTPGPAGLPQVGSRQKIPAGIDPNEWKHMTPQERALWN